MSEQLHKTALYEIHVAAGAKMVPFAGYEMPVQYPLGVKKEHLHTRNAAGLFDVSHMGQLRLKGKNAAAALEASFGSCRYYRSPFSETAICIFY